MMYLVYVLCDKNIPEKTQHTHLLMPEREPTINQSVDTTKVQLGDPMSFTGITYRSMGEGLLRGVEKTLRQLHHQSLSQNGEQFTKTGYQSILHSLKATQQVEECLFQTTQLIKTSFKQFCWILRLPGS